MSPTIKARYIPVCALIQQGGGLVNGSRHLTRDARPVVLRSAHSAPATEPAPRERPDSAARRSQAASGLNVLFSGNPAGITDPRHGIEGPSVLRVEGLSRTS